MDQELQWGGRFASAPDPRLLAFGSSLEDDLVLAPFDVLCSRAHVLALRGGAIVDLATARALDAALARVAAEIETGTFASWARAGDFEDVHGAIDARVRTFCPGVEGERLHAGRSRNDQVATTLLLYARDRARLGATALQRLVRDVLARASEALADGSILAATTHWQPAQPISLAFWLAAFAESLVRAQRRFTRVAADARASCPLGSGACSGSTLPLDRDAAAKALDFDAPSRNALDAIGNRDVLLDLDHAVLRAVGAAARASEEFVLWCTPAFGYARLGDAASTGSSLMPQKRNPDPFELVRAHAHAGTGSFVAAFGSQTSLALSYHRDLQETKGAAIRGIERGFAALDAFARAFTYLAFDGAAMTARARDGYTVATDVADALILGGLPARSAHEFVGRAVTAAEAQRRPLDERDLEEIGRAAGVAHFRAPLDPHASLLAKRTTGSTHPREIERSIEELGRLVAEQVP